MQASLDTIAAEVKRLSAPDPRAESLAVGLDMFYSPSVRLTGTFALPNSF